MPRTDKNPTPTAVPASQLAEFWRVVEIFNDLPESATNQMQKVYERQWDGGQNRIAGRALKLLAQAGRLTDDVDYALDSLCGIVGGASDVAIAILARDLISADDYNRLTRWWDQYSDGTIDPPARPSVAYQLARALVALSLTAAFVAAAAGRLALDSKALPGVIALVTVLAAITAALRPVNH
ncbi:hypothetical protein [Micromonospora sp. DT229]|uniref:hypothetical protein n=1 Tax=Micromonospora sp. DT229 TaxID=3393430 RepID=UPI003CFA5600